MDFPTPPFPDATEIIFLTSETPLVFSGGVALACIASVCDVKETDTLSIPSIAANSFSICSLIFANLSILDLSVFNER